MIKNKKSQILFYVFYFSGFKVGQVHGNRVCKQQLCTVSNGFCTSSTSQHTTEVGECQQSCINDEDCEMVTFHPDAGICSFYKCAQCILATTGYGDDLAVYFCTTGNVIA